MSRLGIPLNPSIVHTSVYHVSSGKFIPRTEMMNRTPQQGNLKKKENILIGMSYERGKDVYNVENFLPTSPF